VLPAHLREDLEKHLTEDQRLQEPRRKWMAHHAHETINSVGTGSASCIGWPQTFEGFPFVTSSDRGQLHLPTMMTARRWPGRV